ncbi:MAG TPA: DUF559 domain-containing protein [Polyangiaceae bacterium]
MLNRHSGSVHHASLLALHAAQMRSAGTASEEKLFRALRARQLGVRFRRQVVIAGMIVDFLAPEAKLAIEVDGKCHARRRSADARRDEKLRRLGYRVLRIEAEVVMRDLEGAVASVREALAR